MKQAPYSQVSARSSIARFKGNLDEVIVGPGSEERND
jgi:hypothetical protein